MSRLLQVVIALVGLAITGVLGLASERNEALQSRHTLIGLFTQTVSTARTTCDRDLAEMAELTLERLNQLEARPRLMFTNEERSDHASTQAAIERYQDIMAGVKGTIDAGCVEEASAPSQEVQATTPSAVAPEETVSQAPATANLELRRAERIELPQAAEIVLERARTQSAPSASGTATAPGDATGPLIGLRAGGYYAVVGSYAVDDAVTYHPERGLVADYRRIRDAAREANIDVRIFQTTTSNHYAIVLVPENLSRDAARELVGVARSRGWSRDAFVQADRNWLACSQPEQITRQNSCAGR